ncbi:hypothetical protein Tco_1011943 [Tanacetum coccineum]
MRATDVADFSNIYDLLLEECVSKDVTCSYLHSLSDLNANTELQCLYLHKVKECECLAQKLSKQTESVNNEVHNKLLKSFAKLEKHSISLKLSLQHCKEQMKNNPVCKENASNVFRKEREQYHEIQDLKAQMQDKNMVINELKKLILVTKGKSVETQFDKPSVVRQPNAQRIPKPSVLGKPTPFSNSPEMRSFQTKQSVNKTNVSDGLFKPVTQQSLPQKRNQAVRNTNVLKPGMFRIASTTTQNRTPQLPHASRNTNPHMSKSSGVIHTTSVSRPQLKCYQVKDKVVPNNSQVKFQKKEVEDHHRISSISKKTKSVTACNDSSNSRTSNANAVCAECGTCVFNSNHDACVSRYLKDVNARTKKPHVVPISASKPKRKANKSVATPHKKTVASDTTIQKSKSYYKELYENTNQEWKWWIAKRCPSGYTWTQKPLRTKKIWMPKIRKDDESTSISPTIDIVSRITNIVQLILFIVDSGCTKHMTGNLKLLCNFVEKFLGTVRFGNDQFAPILGYGDLIQGNVTIKRVYYVEGLNHNLFSVGQFCDADLEVAFRKSTCFVRDLQGNDLLTGSRGSDLYTISLQETTSSTPICFMAKASPTQAWLWHRRAFSSELRITSPYSPQRKKLRQLIPKLKYGRINLDMIDDLEYFNSLEKGHDELESEKADFQTYMNLLLEAFTQQNLPKKRNQAVRNTNVLEPGMYRIASTTTQTRTPQLPHASRNTNPHMSKSSGVIHIFSLSSPSNCDLVNRLFLTSSSYFCLTTEISANAVCAECGKCVFNSNHDACVSRYLKDVHARTKKPHEVPISASKPKRKANKSVATPHKKTVASDTTNQKSKSYYKKLYEDTNQEWKWWIAKRCPSVYTWTQKPLRTKKIWMPKIRKDDESTSISPTIDIVSRITNVLKISNSLGSNLSNVPSSSNSLADCTTHPIHCLVLHQMTSDHNRSELGIQDHSNEPSSSKLVPKVVPLAVKTAT